MKLIGKILGPVYVMVVSFESPHTYKFRLFSSLNGFIIPVLEADTLQGHGEILSKYPLFILLNGAGVIVKSRDTGTDIEKVVIKDEKTFLWSYTSDHEIVFVRREQIADIQKTLESFQAKIMQQHCVKPDFSPEDISLFMSLFYTREMTPGKILRLTPESSLMALWVYNRIKLPVLLIIMFFLVLNFLISGRLNQKYQAQHIYLETLQQKNRQETENRSRIQSGISEFSHTLPYQYAWLCDRIAILIPEDILLTSFSIQPVIKIIEEHKKLQVSENKIVITGEASDSENISHYVYSLQQQNFVKKIALSSVEQNTSTQRFVFRIDLEL